MEDFMFNIARFSGMIIGIVIGLAICFFAFKHMNSNKKRTPDYDERQLIVRGKAYKCGFICMSAAIFALILIDSAAIIIPMVPIVIYFTIFFFGAVGLIIYSIMNDAYWGTNNITSKWIAFFVIFTIVNIGVSIASFVSGNLIVDGIIGIQFVNVLCALLLIILIVTLGIKKLIDNREVSDEES